MSKLTHLDDRGAAHMVDVGAKDLTRREATASGLITMQPATLALLQSGSHKKGDVLAVARIAGIQAAKKCSDLIPLCHTLMLDSVGIEFEMLVESNQVKILGTCRVSGKTGVEMEALTAVSIAALTIYDMCKAVDRGMEIGSVCLQRKDGGQSGTWQRDTTNNA